MVVGVSLVDAVGVAGAGTGGCDFVALLWGEGLLMVYTGFYWNHHGQYLDSGKRTEMDVREALLEP